MSEWTLQYKCRLCGKDFARVDSKKPKSQILEMVYGKGHDSPKPLDRLDRKLAASLDLYPVTSHKCSPRRRGLADLQGIVEHKK